MEDVIRSPASARGAGRAWFAFRTGGGHLVGAAVIAGVGAGAGWFLLLEGGPRPALLVRYLVASAVGRSEALGLAAVFQGRSAMFLVQQCALRMAGAVFLFGCAAALIRSGQRTAVASGRFLRGVRLRDPTLERRRRRRLHGLLSLLVGIMLAAVSAATSYGRGALALGDFVSAGLVRRGGAAAGLLEGRPGEVWCEALGAPGFRPAPEVERRLTAEFGRTCPALLAAMAGKAVLGGGVVFLVLVRLEAARSQNRRRRGYHLAGVEVPPGKECYHFLVTGSPGSGKSTAIKDLLDQIRQRGARAVVYDLSGEYVELFYRPGIDQLLNPLDARGAPWSLWAEAEKPADFDVLARSLFPPGGAEPFWADASAVLFASAARVLDRPGARSNQRLYDTLVNNSIEALREILIDTPASRLLDPAAGSMPSNLIAAVTSRLQAWALLPDAPSASPFSIARFLGNRGDGWLFLSTDEQHAQLFKPLLSLWADIAARALLSRDPTSGRIFCVLDEVASLQRLPALPGLLERGRKHGASVVLGLQAMPQLRDAYGRELAAAIAAQPQTWLVLRTVEPDTARWLESALGQSEVEEVSEAYSLGTAAGAGARDSVSAHERVALRSVALAAEIASLPDHHGFLRLPGGQDVYRVRSAPKSRRPTAARFLAASGAGSTPT